MKIAVAGGGPAGLYFAQLVRRHIPHSEVTVFERNRRGQTFGFGVVFSDQALDSLKAADAKIHERIEPALERWENLTLQINGERIMIDGVGFAAIARLKLLEILLEGLEEAGVAIHYDTLAPTGSELDAYDLVVAADGVNSAIREQAPDRFGTHVSSQTNRFAWFGATRSFDTLTQSFVRTADGVYNAHHYRYAPDLSTFIVEVNENTWQQAGLSGLSQEDSRLHCQQVFADVLEGADLIANQSHWRQFPHISNERWSAGKCVLIGDAAHTAHFSVGSGTRLALEDAQSLCDALVRSPDDIPGALQSHENARRPQLEKIVGAARRSADWYDDFEKHMELSSWQFALSYMNRTGRIDREKLETIAPEFAAGLKRAGA